MLLEYRVQEPVLRLGESLAEADPDAEAALLEGDTLIVEEGQVQHQPRAGEYPLMSDTVWFLLSPSGVIWLCQGMANPVL